MESAKYDHKFGHTKMNGRQQIPMTLVNNMKSTHTK